MKMACDRNYSSLLVFVDASGEAYYQQSQVEKKLMVKGVKHRYPNLFRRRATPEEIPLLMSMGMKAGYQRGNCVIKLLRVNEVNDLLEHGTEKYEAVPEECTRSKKLQFGAGSEKIASTSKELKKPSFSNIQLVSQALLSSQNRGLTLREIEEWISNVYPYFQSVKRSRSIASALSTSKYFALRSRLSRVWHIVGKYEARLRKNAYFPQSIKNINRTNDGRFGILSKQKVLCRINLVEDDMTAVNTSPPQTIESEVLDIIDLVEDDMTTAVNYASTPQKIKPEVLDIIDLVENDESAVDDSPPPEKIKPEILDIINLIENDETVINASPSKEIKLEELDNINLIEDDKNEVDYQSINTSYELLEYKIEPITFPLTNDSINLSAGRIDAQCPICDAKFLTKESLGEHVGIHRRVPSADANGIARETLQNITASLCGRNPESPIFVFSGNVYLTAKNSATP